MTTLKQLQALVDAGDKATQGEWHKHVYGFNGIMSSNTVIFDAYECVNEENQRFITLAANSRPAIKAAIAELEAKDKEIERLRDVVEDAIIASEWYQENSCDFNEADFEWRERAKQALGDNNE